MRKRLVAIVGGIFATVVVAGFACLGVRAGTAPATSISITTPTEGQSIINTNVQIVGKAPAGKLVNVTIADADANKPFIQHQSFGYVDGSVTTDQEGNWVFTPQTQLVPGQFTVSSYYTNTDNQQVKSQTVKFVIINSNGASEVLSQTTILIILGSVALIIIILVTILVIWLKRRNARLWPLSMLRRNKQRSGVSADAVDDFIDEAQIIENELAKTANELAETNAELMSMRRHFGRNAIQQSTPSDQAQNDKKEDS